MGFLLWSFAILSALINLVILTPKKWRVFFWALLPLGDLHGASKVFEEQTLTTAQKRKQTADAKKLEDKVKVEGMVLLRVITNCISVDHPSATHASVLYMARHHLGMSSSNLKSFLGLNNLVSPTATPMQTSSVSSPTRQSSDTPMTPPPNLTSSNRVPSGNLNHAGGNRVTGRSKSPHSRDEGKGKSHWELLKESLAKRREDLGWD